MRRLALAGAVSASLVLGGCTSTRQVADLNFEPPQGNYSLIVMRPDVSVGSLTTGGLVEPREEWTEQARANLISALKTQQAGRGGRTVVAATRTEAGADPKLVADLERLHSAVGASIQLHKYLGVTLPTKRKQGLDWTLGEDAVRFGKATGFDYALFLTAQESRASGGRVAMQVVGLLGCIIGFCAPQGGGSQVAYASLVDLRSGEVVWFNVTQTGSQLPGVQGSDMRSPEGAAALVDRLLDRMKPGRNIRRSRDANSGDRG